MSGFALIKHWSCPPSDYLARGVFQGFMRYASGIMDASTIKTRRLGTRLFSALIGACGFGLELGRAGVYYKRPSPGDSFFLIFMMGLVFLAIAVLNSIRLISKMLDLQDIAKK